MEQSELRVLSLGFPSHPQAGCSPKVKAIALSAALLHSAFSVSLGSLMSPLPFPFRSGGSKGDLLSLVLGWYTVSCSVPICSP